MILVYMMRRLVMSFRRKFNALREESRFFGLSIMLRNLLIWAARKIIVYRVAYVYCARSRALILKCPPPSCNMRFAFLSRDQVDDMILVAADVPQTAGELFVGSIDRQVCFVGVVRRGSFSVPDRGTYELPPFSAYIGSCYTPPEFRGHRIYGTALSQLAAQLEPSGINTIVLYVERENQASIRGVVRQGFHCIARISVIGFGRWRSVGSKVIQHCGIRHLGAK